MLNDTYYLTDEVRCQAEGKWVLIMSSLAPQLAPAMTKMGRSVPCPVHGGRDGFRIFQKDFAQKGGGICNTCGPKADGFAILQWINNWDFWTAKEEVGRTLGLTPILTAKGKARQEQDEKAALQGQPAKAREVIDHSLAPKPHQNVAVAPLVTPIAKSEPAPAALITGSQEWALKLQEKMNNQCALSSDKAADSILRVWNESLSILSPGADVARQYLTNRGITLRSAMLNTITEQDCLRFHPGLPYYGDVEVPGDKEGEVVTKTQMLGKHPALICAIRSKDGDIMTLHRTYLSKKGTKAKVDMARKMMPVPDDRAVVGSAIQTGKPIRGVMGVAEGLETALSAYRVTAIPTWSLVNTTILEGFEPPEGVHTVIIWADKDKSSAGERSATILRQRLEEAGIRVIVMLPSQPIPSRAKGVDWNDVLRTQGLLGFPSHKRLQTTVFGQEVANGSI